MLEADDSVIRVAHDNNVATGTSLPPLVDPQIVDVVEIDVGQERADDRPQPRPLCSRASLLLWAGPTSPSRSSSATASGLPDAVPTTTGEDCDGDLPVPRRKASAHARVCDDAGPARISRSRHGPSRLLLDGKDQRPELVLRRSIPGLTHSPINASLAASRPHAHDSGPV